MPRREVNRADKRKNEYQKAGRDFRSIRIVQAGEYAQSLIDLTAKINEARNLPLDKANEKKLEDLKTAYKTCMTKAEVLLKKGSNIIGSYKSDQIKKLRKAMSKDLQAINKYERKLSGGKLNAPLTFGELLDDARSTKYTVDAKDIKKASAGQHVRAVIPTETKKVYFTESEYGKDQQDRIIDLRRNYRKKYGDTANFLSSVNTDALLVIVSDNESFFKDLYSNSKINVKQSYEEFQQRIKKTFSAIKKHSPEIAERKKGLFDKALDSITLEVDSYEKYRILLEYIKDEKKLILSDRINNHQKIGTDCRQDKRNSAMSAVAGLLDLENTLCHSENATITIKEKGKTKVVKGTAMDEAKGCDIKHFDSNSDLFKFTKASLQNDKLIRSVAELQVLDYLCGNCDRHLGNILYQFDKDGNLIGLQGIDNDSSFGTGYTASSNDGTSVAPEMMSIIPASLAKKIMALDPGEFKMMLYGYDLSTEEADKAAERLQKMKDTIEKSQNFYKNVSDGIIIDGKPRIVDDDKLGEYSVENQLAVRKDQFDKNKKFTHYKGNLFYAVLAGSGVEKCIERAKKCNLATVDTLNSSITEAGGRLEKLHDKMDGMINAWYHLGSRQYDNMLAECERLSMLHRKFGAAIIEQVGEYDKDTKDINKTYKITDDMRTTYREDLMTGLQTIATYLEERAGRNSDVIAKKKNSAGWKRYQFALEFKEILLNQLELLTKAENALKDNAAIDQKKDELFAYENEKLLAHDAKNNAMFNRHAYVLSFNGLLDTVRNKIKSDEEKGHIIDMTDEKLRLAALYGMRASEEELNRGKDIKDDEKQYEIFKKGLAASLIRKKLKLTNQALKTGKKNSPELDALAEIDITTAGDPEKCIENVMKTKGFAKMLENPPKFTIDDYKEQLKKTKEVDDKMTDAVTDAFLGRQAKTEAKKDTGIKI